MLFRSKWSIDARLSDNLCAALLARNGTEIRRLCGILARALPRRVREENYAIARQARKPRAPVQTLHFYHQTLHLLGARPANRGEAGLTGGAERSGEERQIEMPLPLRAAGG